MFTQIKIIGNRVYLVLPNKEYKQERKIGIINSQTRTLHTKRTEKHLFRKFNAFGINYELLKYGGIYFDFVIIEYGFEKLITTREYFLENGEILYFKNNQLEKQVFLPLDKFGLDKIKSKKEKDPDLFSEVV